MAHLVHYIEEYGSPEGWDAGSFEMAQKMFVKVPFRRVAPKLLGQNPYHVQTRMLKLVLNRQWLALAKRLVEKEGVDEKNLNLIEEGEEVDEEEDGLGSSRQRSVGWEPHSGFTRYGGGLCIVGTGESVNIQRRDNFGWVEVDSMGPDSSTAPPPKPWPEREYQHLDIDSLMEAYGGGLLDGVRGGYCFRIRGGLSMAVVGGDGRRLHIKAGRGGDTSLVKVDRLNAFGRERYMYGDVVEAVFCLEVVDREDRSSLHLLGVRTSRVSDPPDYNGIDSRIFNPVFMVGSYTLIRADSVVGGVVAYESYHRRGDKGDLSVPRVFWVMNDECLKKLGTDPLDRGGGGVQSGGANNTHVSDIAKALIELAKTALFHV